MKTKLLFIGVLLFACIGVTDTFAQRIVEKLSRGVLALSKGSGDVYVGWRLLGTDPEDVAFNLYRKTTSGEIKIASNLTTSTNFLDKGVNVTIDNIYYVRAIVNGVEQAPSKSYTLKANTVVGRYIRMPLTPEPDAPLVTNSSGTQVDPYSSGSTWVGDVDADGEWEYIILRSYEGSVAPTSRPLKIDCYELDGTLLWRCDLGANVSGGVNGHGVMAVADFDGDGKAEVATKTCEETVFNYGSKDSVRIGDTDTYGFGKDGKTRYQTDITGPEFLSIIDGATGKEKARTNFEPGNGWNPVTGTNGYTRYGANERPMYIYFAVAYLDGVLPSLVLVRGAGGNNTPAFAFDYRNGKLSERWRWGYEFGAKRGLSQAHNILCFDVDNDGKDEVVFLGSAVDHDGKTLFDNTNFTHGDHYRLMDMDPDRPGYEFFAIQQNNSSLIGMSINDALTGDYIKKHFLAELGDLSRGDAGDYDPRHKGAEYFSIIPGLFSCKGVEITHNYPRFPTWDIWWDANLGREFIDGVNAVSSAPAIENWSTSNNKGDNRMYSVYNEGVHMGAYNGRPSAWGDFYGDWREEMLLEENTHRAMRLYMSWDVAPNRIYNLMQNPGYRMEHSTKGRIGAAYPDFYLGYDMQTPPPPPIVEAKLHWANTTTSVWDKTAANWHSGSTTAPFADGDTLLFDLAGDNTRPITLNGVMKPGKITVHSPIDYSFNGTGILDGNMPLVKVGKSTLTLNNKNVFTGKTTVWDGALIVNDSLKNSPVTVYGGVWGGPMAKGLTGGRIGGSGYFGGDVLLKYGAAIIPGAGMASADTLTFNNLTEEVGAVNHFDLSDDPTGISGKNDFVQVNGIVSVLDTITFSINKLNSKLTPGEYKLLAYKNGFKGDLNKIKVTGCDEYPYSLTKKDSSIVLTIKSTRPASEVVWSGTAKLWDMANTAAWIRNGQSDVFVNQDSVVFDDRGKANTMVYMATPLFVKNIVVDGSANYTIAGKGIISGTGGLTKKGTGTLRLVNENAYTGKTIIEGGTLEITNLDDPGLASSIGAAPDEAENLVLKSGGTFSLVGSATSTNRKLILDNGDCTLNVIPGSTMTLLDVISGKGRLIKTGSGNLQLNAANLYTGGTIVKEGTLILGSKLANTNGVGTGSITLLGGKLAMANVQASETASWDLIVPTGSTASFEPDGRCYLNGKLIGGGNLTVTPPYVRSELKGDWSEFTGQITFNGQDVRISNSYGYAKAIVNLVDGIAYPTTTGAAVEFGDLRGTKGAYLKDGTFTTGSRNTDVSFGASISGTANVIKTGTAAWTWTDTLTYTGTTVVNGGKLLLGSIAFKKGEGSVTIKNGATLGGLGKIAGAISVEAGGIVAPGMTGVGTFNVVNTLLMSKGSILKIDVNRQAKLCDVVNSTGSVFLMGNLEINKQDTAQFKVGDKYRIIKATTVTGSFTTITPAAPGVGLAWDLSELNTLGTIGVKAAPTAIQEVEIMNLDVYPNPVVDKLTVTVSDNLAESTLKIYSANGTLISEKNITSVKTTVDFSKLNAGVYLIKVEGKNGSAVKQVVKK